ncbi:uncharacterized protein EHS24_007780 [Apiotrichum porosum]|uniref:F-box domain-containing protein n=1 Tax=Apiotrichum porosum TaxID=105984 RepID=A0A427XVM9_9TREE|nr:uncharacterized protein EHS24_007780 [Apiotrichum porosum]RSH82785.1 hypothetical protein EHS24_007780 [Apiotrichum porosum]
MSAAVFTPGAFPHITQAIVSRISAQDRNTLRAVCRNLRDVVDIHLVAHIDIVALYAEDFTTDTSEFGRRPLRVRNAGFIPYELRSYGHGGERVAAFCPATSPTDRSNALLEHVRAVDLDGGPRARDVAGLIPFLTGVTTVRLCWSTEFCRLGFPRGCWHAGYDEVAKCTVPADTVVSFMRKGSLPAFSSRAARKVTRLVFVHYEYRRDSLHPYSNLTSDLPHVREIVLMFGLSVRTWSHPGSPLHPSLVAAAAAHVTWFGFIQAGSHPKVTVVDIDNMWTWQATGKGLAAGVDCTAVIPAVKAAVAEEIRRTMSMSEQESKEEVERRFEFLSAPQYRARVGDDVYALYTACTPESAVSRLHHIPSALLFPRGYEGEWTYV